MALVGEADAGRPLAGADDNRNADCQTLEIVSPREMPRRRRGLSGSLPILDPWTDHRLSFEAVVNEEKSAILSAHQARANAGFGSDKPKFSLAFSGGGMRAAAFQAGVLWRLAQANQLQNVDYFTAVSGGAYAAAAFTSYCLKAVPPQNGTNGDDLRAWYLGVVGRCCCRMQTNAGNFVRDVVKYPWYSTKQSGLLPRICDLPILLGVTLFALLSNWIVAFGLWVVVPAAIISETFFGGGMRAAHCSINDRLHRYFQYSSLWTFAISIVLVGVAAIVNAFGRKLLPCCKQRKRDGTWKDGRCFMFGHSLEAALIWYCVIASAYFVLIGVVPFVKVDFTMQKNDSINHINMCLDYLKPRKDLGGVSQVHMCSDGFFESASWYTDARKELLEKKKEIESAPKAQEPHTSDYPSINTDSWTLRLPVGIPLIPIFIFICGVGAFVVPVCGGWLVSGIFSLFGPFAVVVIFLWCIQRCVIVSPLSGDGSIDRLLSIALVGGTPFILSYSLLRRTSHVFYKRTLQTNFFCNGEDFELSQLVSRDNPSSKFIPFTIVTGTCSDYLAPGSQDSISEIGFSPLHTGGMETLYTSTPSSRTMARCAALSGAACFDAISLSLSRSLKMRFWLEILNLTWGDFVLFQYLGTPCFTPSIGYISKLLGGRFKQSLYRGLHGMPVCVLRICIILSTYIGWSRMYRGDCTDGKRWIILSLCLWTAFFILGFFWFLPGMDLFALDPAVRSLHQALRFFYVGQKPPRMIYVTDGGVKDCTGLIQLLRRGSERILLALASWDPHEDFAVFKAALTVAEDEKLAVFYNPRDPRMGIAMMMDEFVADRSIPYLHIGIRYRPSKTHQTRIGHLYVVKNRLISEFENMPVLPPLTLEEIVGERGPQPDDNFDETSWRNVTIDQLGPWGCCDCCHTAGLNCGAKFPHGNGMGYLTLSPQYCSSLIRLGHAASAAAVEAVTAAGLIRRPWEDRIDEAEAE